MVMVDASQLQKDPSLEFPGGRGWEEKVQSYIVVQHGAPELVQRVFNLCMDHAIVGVFCKSGHHRSVAVAEMAADWFRRATDHHEVCVLHLNSAVVAGWSANKLTEVLAWRGGLNNVEIPATLLGGGAKQSNSPAGTQFGPCWSRKAMEDLYNESLQVHGLPAWKRVVPPEPKKKPRESVPSVPKRKACEVLPPEPEPKKKPRSSGSSAPAVLERGTKHLRDDELPSSPAVQQLDSSSSRSDEEVLYDEEQDPIALPPELVVDYDAEGFWDAAEVMEDLLGTNPHRTDVKEMACSIEYEQLCDKLLGHLRNEPGLTARIMCVQARYRLHAGTVAHMGMTASDLQRFMKGPILLLELRLANGQTLRDALRHFGAPMRQRYKAWVQDIPVQMHHEEMEQMYINYRNYRKKKLDRSS